MAIQIAVIDDLKSERETLKSYLERMELEGKQSFSIKYYTCSEEVLADTDSKFDIMIFDIDMPGMNGMDAAREIRKRDNNVVIMFVTNVAQYAINGYEVGAVDYVLKPLSYQDFALKMQKASRYVQRNRDAIISLRTTDGVVSVQISEILYVESALHYLMYHTTRGGWKVRGSIAQADKELMPFRFARCNSGILVNLRHVQAIEKEDVLIGGQRLKISRGKRLEFMNAFTRYLGGMV